MKDLRPSARRISYKSLPCLLGSRAHRPKIGGMKWAILIGLLVCCSVAFAQEPVEISAEPHYTLLLENEDVRVYLLTLHPNDSAMVRMRHSFITVPLQDGEIIMWDEGKSPIQHFQLHVGETNFHCLSPVCVTPELLDKGIAGGFRNDRASDFRNITVEFLDANVGWAMTGGGTINSSASMYVGGAVVSDVKLDPESPSAAPHRPGGQLIIPLSDIDLQGKGLRIRKSAGEVMWIPSGQTSALTNDGTGQADFISVELRPGDYASPTHTR